MRVFVKRLGMVVLILIGGIQLIPVDRSNPPVIQSDSIYVKDSIPLPVRSVFHRSCSDCHSNETKWPWYSYVAPVSWFVAHHVHKARGYINFSEWGALSPQKREQSLEAICEQLTNSEMPDHTYLFVHRNARVTPEESAVICQWIEDERK